MRRNTGRRVDYIDPSRSRYHRCSICGLWYAEVDLATLTSVSTLCRSCFDSELVARRIKQGRR